MAVKAYLVHKEPNAPKLDRHVLSLTGPYLFRNEAEKFAHAITEATGNRCQISTIFVERILRDVVLTGDHLNIADVWNIREIEDSFVGDATIDGRLQAVKRLSSDLPWQTLP